MKTQKIKSKLDKILGLSAKEDEIEKILAIIDVLLEKLKRKESKLKKQLHNETDTASINKLQQKLKLVKRQIEKADNHRRELKEN